MKMTEYAYSKRVKTGDIVNGLVTHDLTFWYNSKTHKYNIVDATTGNEMIMTKAKAEAVIEFLRFLHKP